MPQAKKDTPTKQGPKKSPSTRDKALLALTTREFLELGERRALASSQRQARTALERAFNTSMPLPSTSTVPPAAVPALPRSTESSSGAIDVSGPQRPTKRETEGSHGGDASDVAAAKVASAAAQQTPSAATKKKKKAVSKHCERAAAPVSQNALPGTADRAVQSLSRKNVQALLKDEMKRRQALQTACSSRASALRCKLSAELKRIWTDDVDVSKAEEMSARDAIVHLEAAWRRDMTAFFLTRQEVLSRRTLWACEASARRDLHPAWPQMTGAADPLLDHDDNGNGAIGTEDNTATRSSITHHATLIVDSAAATAAQDRPSQCEAEGHDTVLFDADDHAEVSLGQDSDHGRDLVHDEMNGRLSVEEEARKAWTFIELAAVESSHRARLEVQVDATLRATVRIAMKERSALITPVAGAATSKGAALPPTLTVAKRDGNRDADAAASPGSATAVSIDATAAAQHVPTASPHRNSKRSREDEEDEADGNATMSASLSAPSSSLARQRALAPGGAAQLFHRRLSSGSGSAPSDTSVHSSSRPRQAPANVSVLDTQRAEKAVGEAEGGVPVRKVSPLEWTPSPPRSSAPESTPPTATSSTVAPSPVPSSSSGQCPPQAWTPSAEQEWTPTPPKTPSKSASAVSSTGRVTTSATPTTTSASRSAASGALGSRSAATSPNSDESGSDPNSSNTSASSAKEASASATNASSAPGFAGDSNLGEAPSGPSSGSHASDVSGSSRFHADHSDSSDAIFTFTRLPEGIPENVPTALSPSGSDSSALPASTELISVSVDRRAVSGSNAVSTDVDSVATVARPLVTATVTPASCTSVAPVDESDAPPAIPSCFFLRRAKRPRSPVLDDPDGA